MNKRSLFLALGFFVLLLAGNSFAFPQIFPTPAVSGPSGVVRIPSADIIPYKNFNVGADLGANIVSGLTPSSETTFYYKMNLGTFHGVEVGIVGGSDQGTSKIREGVFINMKLSLSTGEEPNPLLLAIGVENLFSYYRTDVYMVATKYFKQGPKLTFGFMGDFPGNNKFRPLGLAGIEIPVGDPFVIASDFMIGETLSQLNGGARLYFTPIFSLNFSVLNILNDPQAKDSRAALIGFSWANPF
jgi:hypothetical protein